MKYIEKQILLSIMKEITLKDKIILTILKRYSYNIYKIGYDKGFNFQSWQGCNKAVITEKQKIENKNKKILKVNGE